MTRNRQAIVDWPRIGAVVLQTCAEEYKKSPYGYQNRVCQRIPDEGLTASRLDNWLRAQPKWHAIRDGLPEPKQIEKVEVPPPTPEEAFQQASSEQAARDEINALRAQLKVAAREKNLRETLWEIAKETAPQLPPAAPLWKPAKQDGAIVETMFQFYSDLHAYEYVSHERTRGHNEYTAEIMGRRVAQSVAKHLNIKRKLERGGWQFPECVVALGGDNVSGTIHELERHIDTAGNIVLAVYGCAWLYAQALREYARVYPKVYVFGVGGNHARLPGVKRKQMKDPTRTWDYLVYLLLRQMLAEQNNVEFWFPDSWAAQVNIRGWNFLLGHGDDIKSWSGIPFYGIQRRTGQLLALEGARANVIHYQLFGHFHQGTQLPNPAGETFVNGSVIGGTEYTIDGLGVSDKPQQLMFGVHEDHGVTHRWPLVLEPQDADIPQFTVNPWLDVQQATDGEKQIWQVTD